MDDHVPMPVRGMAPDRFFTAEQQARLCYLVARNRDAAAGGLSLSVEDRSELEELIRKEILGTAAWAAEMLAQRDSRK